MTPRTSDRSVLRLQPTVYSTGVESWQKQTVLYDNNHHHHLNMMWTRLLRTSSSSTTISHKNCINSPFWCLHVSHSNKVCCASSSHPCLQCNKSHFVQVLIKVPIVFHYPCQVEVHLIMIPVDPLVKIVNYRAGPTPFLVWESSFFYFLSNEASCLTRRISRSARSFFFALNTNCRSPVISSSRGVRVNTQSASVDAVW